MTRFPPPDCHRLLMDVASFASAHNMDETMVITSSGGPIMAFYVVARFKAKGPWHDLSEDEKSFAAFS